MKKLVFCSLALFIFLSSMECHRDPDPISVSVSGVTVKPTSASLTPGSTLQLIATVQPSNAANKKVTWSSDNTSRATVNTSTGLVTIPATATPGTATITVTTNDGGKTATYSVRVFDTQYRIWGLGENITDAHSNNVTYEWYIDQINTGLHAYVNCGPACVTMAIKWSDINFTKTAEDARNAYRPEGGWWYTNDIVAYLNDNKISNYITTFTEITPLITQLNNGNIVILCLDMYYVRYHLGASEWHIDKFYVTEDKEWGHFVVVKGFKEVDGIIWLEVYDPWSLHVKYSDGSLKGRDRYYRSDDIMQATNVWWKYMIVVNNPAATTVGTKAIDPVTIVHQRGK